MTKLHGYNPPPFFYFYKENWIGEINMEMFMLISFSIVVIVALVTLFSIIKLTLTFEKEDRNRIVDLFVIGLIIYIVGMIHPSNYAVPNILALSGSLIFLYGFVILLYKKFIEGYQESFKKK